MTDFVQIFSLQQLFHHKMLTTQLKKLEKAGLVNRKEYQQVPPKVEYSLTQMGRDLEPVVKEIHTWIMRYNI